MGKPPRTKKAKKRVNNIDISLVLSPFWKMLQTGEMLIMLVMLVLFFFKKVRKTGEMLIMLIMLIPQGLWGNPPGPKEPKIIDITNIFPVLSTFLKNVLKAGEMLIMLILLSTF